MKLYEIMEEIDFVYEDCVDPETGEISDVKKFEERMGLLEGDRVKKLLDIACVVKSAQAEALALKNEEDRLKRRRGTAERKAQRLIDYAASALNDGERVKDARAEWKWRKSSRVVIDDAAQIHPQYGRFRPAEFVPDKNALNKALKDGSVAGAHLEHVRALKVG